jgi:NADH-quinone oxidoreductase subunit M
MLISLRTADGPLASDVAIAVPWLAALIVAVYRRHVRIIGFVAALISAIACGLALSLGAPGQSLYQALMLLFACLTLGATLALPRRDCTAGNVSGILFILGSTLLAYSADNLLTLLAAWILTITPFFLPRWFHPHSWRPLAALLLSGLALGVAIVVIAFNTHTIWIVRLQGQSPGGMATLGLLIAAVIFRKGILPAHAWVADAAAGGSLIPTALLFNGHFGALLVAKLIVPLFAGATVAVFPILSYLAMATALYVAIRALTENSPRRLLAFVSLSQSAAILAGLESGTAEGITGALVHWYVVTVSTVALFGILRLLEVRFGENLTTSTHLGLARHAPRLAVSFAVFGLALVGLPGTLSFCSQDLLIHGTLQSHPLTGILLPISTAMNAVSIFRLFTRLFLGKRRTGFTAVVDALPRERWVLAIGSVFVVLGGLFPNVLVARRAAEADLVAGAVRPHQRISGVTSIQSSGSVRR